MGEILKIGCCGFAGGLNSYLSRFSLVEIQQTFYSPPREATLSKWRKNAPAEFEFVLKAWQAITHPPTSLTWRRCPEDKRPKQFKQVGSFKPTKTVFQAWENVLSWSKILDSRVIVFQTPPSFKPTNQNISNVEAFFSTIDRDDLILCWEPRGEWLASVDILKSVVDKFDIVHVVDPFWDKPVSSASLIYFRLHGLGRRYNYAYDYSESDLKRLKTIVKEYIEDGKITYVLFNNINMLKSALAFKRLFEDN
jgi:uncharacterized protein YecE (DUF72 family)